MPVSKKRKKDGKPVHRSVAPPPPAAEPGVDPVAPVVEAAATRRFGKPSNPFVARQSSRSAQRGR